MSDKFFTLKYRFSSRLDFDDMDRYITTYKVKIYEEAYDREGKLLIGKVTVKLLLACLICDEEFSLAQVLDTAQDVANIGEMIFDGETEELNEDIQKFYDYGIGHADVCLLTRIEIRESHRRRGIGKKVVKDIFNRFKASCGLFVVQAFPLQFESRIERGGFGALPKWSEKMNFSSLENDFEKAFYQLKAFYQKIGFDHIDGYNELMFLNSALLNDKMDQIVLE